MGRDLFRDFFQVSSGIFSVLFVTPSIALCLWVPLIFFRFIFSASLLFLCFSAFFAFLLFLLVCFSVFFALKLWFLIPFSELVVHKPA